MIHCLSFWSVFGTTCGNLFQTMTNYHSVRKSIDLTKFVNVCMYCLSVLPLEGARTLRCTLLSLSWNLFVPREYYIRRLCGRMSAVLLYRDTLGRLLAEICVDELWFFHAQWRLLWIRVLSGVLFLTSAPGLGRRIDKLLLSPRCSIAAATVRVLPADFAGYRCKRDPIEYHVHIFIILGCFVTFNPGVHIHPPEVYSPV